MQTIKKDHVVEINYTLKDEDGSVLDTTSGKEPLAYLHGHGNLIGGLEEKLLDKKVGEKLHAEIAPKDAYGEVDQNLVITFPKEEFKDQVSNLEVGMQFQVQGEGEQALIMTVIQIKEDEVILDGNHPLAGATLFFDVEIIGVRAATNEEIEQGGVVPKISSN